MFGTIISKKPDYICNVECCYIFTVTPPTKIANGELQDVPHPECLLVNTTSCSGSSSANILSLYMYGYHGTKS